MKAAVFVLNGDDVLKVFTAGEDNVVDRLAKLERPAGVADELYLRALSRLPTDEERADVASYLAKHAKNRPQSIGRLLWALLASTEFCTNH